jgi:hypothetical protein
MYKIIYWQWFVVLLLITGVNAYGQTQHQMTVGSGQHQMTVGSGPTQPSTGSVPPVRSMSIGQPLIGDITTSTLGNTFIRDDGPGGGFWVTVSDADDDLRKAKDACDEHPDYAKPVFATNTQYLSGDGSMHYFTHSDSKWNPQPCARVYELYRTSGAERRFADIEAKREARELAFVKRVAGQK